MAGIASLFVVARAAQDRLDPLDQQTLAEGLVHIVVGPKVEAEDLVDLFVLGGQDNDRDVRSLAQAAKHLHAIHPGHLNIENDQIRRIAFKRGQARGTVIIGLHNMAVAFKGQGDGGDDVFIVIDQGNFRH